MLDVSVAITSCSVLSGQMVLQSGKPFNLKLAKALYSRTRVIRLSFAVIRNIGVYPDI
jgi:hypothetical protein